MDGKKPKMLIFICGGLGVWLCMYKCLCYECMYIYNMTCLYSGWIQHNLENRLKYMCEYALPQKALQCECSTSRPVRLRLDCFFTRTFQ